MALKASNSLHPFLGEVFKLINRLMRVVIKRKNVIRWKLPFDNSMHSSARSLMYVYKYQDIFFCHKPCIATMNHAEFPDRS